MQQHRADSLLFPPPFLFSPSPFHFKSAGGTKGYTVSRRIPFEPPLIKLKSRKRSLLINLFNRGNRGYRSSKRLFPSFASITTDLQNTEKRSERKKKDQMENKKERRKQGAKREEKEERPQGGGGRGGRGRGKKWKSACFEVLSTKLEFQKGQVKFSIPSIPASRPQPSCDPPRLLISFSTLFRPTVFPPPLPAPLPAPLIFLPHPHVLPYLHFFSFVSSTSMKRFVHRAHLYSSCTNLVWYTLYITPASY